MIFNTTYFNLHTSSPGVFYNVTNSYHVSMIHKTKKRNFSPLAQLPLVGQGLLIIEASRSHFVDTPQSVGLLWTSDQPVAEAST
jgi:hypothetical protein